MKKFGFGESLRNLLRGKSEIPPSFFDDLTDTLIEGDVGAKTAFAITELLEKK